ncbi:hypothetical protein BGZ51_001124 [Haplosporangium sp. Z 767]|nr:hypothetical protein BGZ51_001124 [Haplosporangium sp. Z 767]
MDRIVAECSQRPDFFLTCTEIFRFYSSDSSLLSVVEWALSTQDDLLQSLLQDAVEMTSEIDDWRMVRLWILFFEWILDQLPAESMQVRQNSSAGLKQERPSVSMISNASFWDMIFKAQSVHRQGLQDSTTISYFQAIDQLLDAQRAYIFLSAASEQLTLRRRLAFLIGAAAAQRTGTLVWILRDHFQSLEQAVDYSVGSKGLLPHRVQSIDAVSSFLAHLSLAYDSEKEFGAIGERFATFLKELQTLNKLYIRDEASNLALEAMLERITQTYLPLLRLSSVFLADILCATVVYINCNDTKLWKLVIKVFLRTTSESPLARAPNPFKAPLIARLRDIVKNWKPEQSNEKNEFGVQEHFQSLFDTREKLLEIPVLDSQSINTLPVNSLVRLRCMVQDTELAQEVALFASTVITRPDGEQKLACHRYSDGPQEDYEMYSDSNQDIMDLRNSYYCVSVPGESQWVKEYERSGASSLDESLKDMNLGDTAPLRVIPERYPFPGGNHFAAVVKTHSSDATIGVTDMIEVIGVLGASDRVLTGNAFEIPDESTNAPRIPTVHAIIMRKVEDHGHPELGLNGHPELDDIQMCAKDAAAIRKDLIQYISSAVHGDQLAAELVLLHLLARVYLRPSGAVLGKFSLNLKDTSTNSTVPQNLTRIMKNILPKVHAIPMTLQNLNNNFFFPRGDEQLSSGILQVTRGTALVLDETAMDEGTLVDKGLKNLKAVSDVSMYQTLNYVFPFNNLEFQTDISLLIVSLGNSLVPVDCSIALMPETLAGTQPTEPTEEQLQSFRKYISVYRLAEYKFSEEIAKEIEMEFMEERKAASAAGTTLISPNELAFNISLAR